MAEVKRIVNPKLDIKKYPYFVCSQGENPVCIKFKAADAFDGTYEYIDIFDVNGNKVGGFKLVDDHYTDQF